MTVGVEAPTAEQWAMVEEHRGLALSYVGRLILTPEEREDAVQDAMFGLLRAAQKFNPESGWQFSTYAQRWIVASVQRGRQTYLGRNYRRARRDGAEWVPPAGLDAVAEPQHRGDDLFATVCCSSAIAEMRAACRDDLDHAIVDRIEAGDDGFRARLAVERGVCVNTVSNRTSRLAHFARPLLAA